MAENITIDHLAAMIKGEFDNMGEKIEKIKSEMSDGFKKLEQDHEKLELRMSNVAYRFEVDDLKNQLNILRQRVDSLENK